MSHTKCELQFLPSERGRQILIFENYRYHLKRINKSGKAAWACVKRGHKTKCGAVLFLIDGVFHSKSGFHNHDPEVKKIKRKKLILKMKEAAVKNVTVPLETIYAKEIAEAAIFFEDYLPQFDYIRRTLIKTRNSAAGKQSTEVYDVNLSYSQEKTEDKNKFFSTDGVEERTELSGQTNAVTEKRNLPSTSSGNKIPNFSEEASRSKRIKLCDSAISLETMPPIPEACYSDCSDASESELDTNTVIKQEIFEPDEDADATELVSNEPNNSLMNSEIVVKQESFEIEEPSENSEVGSFRNSTSVFETSETPPIIEVSSTITNYELVDGTDKPDSLVKATVKPSLYSQILNVNSPTTTLVKEKPGSYIDSTLKDSFQVSEDESVTIKEEPSSPIPNTETSSFNSMLVERTLSDFANTVASVTCSLNANLIVPPSSSNVLGNPLAKCSNMIATTLDAPLDGKARHIEFSESVKIKEEPSSPEPESVSLEDSNLVAEGRNEAFSKLLTIKEEPSSPAPVTETSLCSTMPVTRTVSDFANTPVASIASSSSNSLSGFTSMEGNPLTGSATLFSVPGQSAVCGQSLMPGAVSFVGPPVQGNYLYGSTIVSNSLPPQATSQGNETTSYFLPGSANLVTTSLPGYPIAVGNSLSNLISMVDGYLPNSSPMMSSLPASAIGIGSPFPGSLPGSATSVGTSLPSPANVIGNYLPSTNYVLPHQISYPFGYSCPTIIGPSLPGSSNVIQTSFIGSSNVIQTSVPGISKTVPTSLPASSNVIQTSLLGSSNVVSPSNSIQTSLTASPNVIQTSSLDSANVTTTSSSSVIQTSSTGSKMTGNNLSPEPENIVRTLLNSASILRSSISSSTKKVKTSLSSSTTGISNSTDNIDSPSPNSSSSSSSCSTTSIKTSEVESESTTAIITSEAEPKSLLQGSAIVIKEESFEVSETPVELDSFAIERINKQRELIKADFEKQIKLKTMNYLMKF